MSNGVNDELLERAGDMVDYWEGSLHAELIRKDMETNDLESLVKHVYDAEAEASRREFYEGADVE